MFTLTASPAVVKVAALLPFASPLIVASPADAERARLEADYREYSEWLDANADQLADEARGSEMVESGSWAW